jgi:hypothetical protein
MRRRKPAKDKVHEPMTPSDDANSVVATPGSTSHRNGRTDAAPETLDVVTDDTVADPTPEGAPEDTAETTIAPGTDEAAGPEMESRGAHARKGDPFLPDEQRGAHLMSADPLLSVERRAIHALNGEALVDEPRGAHVMRGDPLDSVEGRALHARKAEALTEVRSAPIAMPAAAPVVSAPLETTTPETVPSVGDAPDPAQTASEIPGQDNAAATAADSATTKRRTARAKRRKARRSKRAASPPQSPVPASGPSAAR